MRLTMDMGNLMDWIIALQEARAQEMWIGPRIFPQGMSIGGTAAASTRKGTTTRK